MRLERYPEAISELSKIIRDNGLCPLEVYELASICLIHQNKVEDAIELIEMILSINPNSVTSK